MIYTFVEGQSDEEAVGNLIWRIGNNHFPSGVKFAKPLKSNYIHNEIGIRKLLEIAKTKPEISGLLLIRDSEDECPKQLAPKISQFISNQSPSFPVALVLMYREFEKLYLAVSRSLAGKTIKLRANQELTLSLQFPHLENPESKRGAKEYLNSFFPRGQVYKSSLHQGAFMRAIDLDDLRKSNLSSFIRLEKAICHLCTETREHNIYPYSTS